MKPDITFFGEQLPENFKIAINQDINKVDLVLVIGTSLKVVCVADIVGKYLNISHKILLNKDPINHCQFDVSLLGYCDDVASYIANELGESWIYLILIIIKSVEKKRRKFTGSIT